MSSEERQGELRGPQLARAALEAARAGSRSTLRSRRGSTPRTSRGSELTARGADDPVRVGSVLASLLRSRQWQQPIAEGRVFGTWEKIVGPDIAAHATPLRLRDGELTIRAHSPAWASQLRLLSKTLLAKIAHRVGAGIVRKLRIYSL